MKKKKERVSVCVCVGGMCVREGVREREREEKRNELTVFVNVWEMREREYVCV